MWLFGNDGAVIELMNGIKDGKKELRVCESVRNKLEDCMTANNCRVGVPRGKTSALSADAAEAV